VQLEHLQIVQPAQSVLDPFQLTDERSSRPEPTFRRNLQAVAQLLGGYANPMEAVRVVDLPGLVHCHTQALGALGEPRRERSSPAFRLGILQGLGHRRKTPIQLVDFHPVQPFQHRRAALLALFDDVGPDFLERGLGERVSGGEIVEDLEGDVQLPDGAQGAGQLTDFQVGLLRLGAPDVLRQHRDRLAEPPRRHSGLVDAYAVPSNCSG
jgi:hypothetical protein